MIFRLSRKSIKLITLYVAYLQQNTQKSVITNRLILNIVQVLSCFKLNTPEIPVFVQTWAKVSALTFW